jgi:V/A-type H+-transporting ATPase subunit I
MAIAQMTKVMIVCHRSQVSDLLEALQEEGICQILNAEEAMVSKDTPELVTVGGRPKDIEETIARLDKSIGFLKGYAEPEKGLASMLAPRKVVERRAYQEVVTDVEILNIVDEVERLQVAMDKTRSEIESLQGTLDMLGPWASLQTPVEEIGRLRTSVSWAGLVPAQHIEHLEQQVAEEGAAIQRVGSAGTREACIVVALQDNAEQTQKLLRSLEFEVVNFESMSGTVAELMRDRQQKLEEAGAKLDQQGKSAEKLTQHLLKMQILLDHYENLLQREQTRETAPATQHTLILEGWVKKHNYERLVQVVGQFDAASLSRIKPGAEEEIPVEIENNAKVRPFEVITRLYGMPQHFEVDPTTVLAPFFAVFFGLCLTDAGYGLVIIALMALLIKKAQGDKKLYWMLGVCAGATVLAGALTGGWFGDGIQQFIPGMKGKNVALWFDPMKKPMTFFYLSIGLGYFQIMVGLAVGFVHNLRRKELAAAIFDYLVWLVMLNAIVLFLAGLFGALPAALGTVCGYIALVPAAMILLFSHREGGWGGRIGMGLYNLFSTIFYMGDVLSYLRLMALGMVTAGLAMAINVIVKIVGDIPYGIGIVAMIIVFVGGHLFNLAINALGAFVHTLRLQYVEFFPKFFAGGGKQFAPLSKKYEHIYIQKDV